MLEKAFRLDPTDARVLMELDQLYKRLNRPHTERMAFLEQYMDIVITRDDLYLEYVTLLNQTGQYRKPSAGSISENSIRGKAVREKFPHNIR